MRLTILPEYCTVGYQYVAWAKCLAGAAACLRFLCADAIAPDRTGSGWDQRNMRERACTAWPRTRRPSSRLSLVPLSRRRSKAAQHSTSALLPSSQCPVVLAEAGSVPTQLKLREMRCGQDSGRARSVPVVNEDFILLVRTVQYVL